MDIIDVGLAEMFPASCIHDCCPLDHCELRDEEDQQ